MDFNAVESLISIHNLIQKKIPKELCSIISNFAIAIMWCEKCGKNLQIDYLRKKPLSWIISDKKILCKNCYPSLQDCYKKRFKIS